MMQEQAKSRLPQRHQRQWAAKHRRQPRASQLVPPPRLPRLPPRPPLLVPPPRRRHRCAWCAAGSSSRSRCCGFTARSRISTKRTSRRWRRRRLWKRPRPVHLKRSTGTAQLSVASCTCALMMPRVRENVAERRHRQLTHPVCVGTDSSSPQRQSSRQSEEMRAGRLSLTLWTRSARPWSVKWRWPSRSRPSPSTRATWATRCFAKWVGREQAWARMSRASRRRLMQWRALVAKQRTCVHRQADCVRALTRACVGDQVRTGVGAASAGFAINPNDSYKVKLKKTVRVALLNHVSPRTPLTCPVLRLADDGKVRDHRRCRCCQER